MRLLIVLTLIVGSSLSQESNTTKPVVIWHGMGDTCCYPFSMGRIKKVIEKHVPGIYVHSLMIGGNIVRDEESGFFINSNKQVEDACQQISSDPELQGGYHAMGFSQGSQFLRAVAQRCPHPPMHNLITFGGQHQGIFGFPNCPREPEDSRLCEYVRRILNHGAYTKLIQDISVQAQYWHDPLHEDAYQQKNIFLADINNEKVVKKSYYRDNLMKLDNFVMVKFLQDSMVVPIESEWFGFYLPGQDEVVVPMNETQLYNEDWIGLKAMDEAGKLHFLSVDGDHLQFDTEWFLKEIVDNYVV